jgi:hypothetical protein
LVNSFGSIAGPLRSIRSIRTRSLFGWLLLQIVETLPAILMAVTKQCALGRRFGVVRQFGR